MKENAQLASDHPHNIGAIQLVANYVELAKKSFQRQVAYRTATLAGLITNMFFGVLRASILIAVYNAQTRSVPDYSVRDAITYTGMTQGFIGAVALWGWYDMIKSIKSGEVANSCTRRGHGKGAADHHQAQHDHLRCG